MLLKKTITGLQVVTLTNVNESGNCWLKEEDENKAGKSKVKIYHTDEGEPSIETVRDLGKNLYTPVSNIDTMPISADSTADIYYAVCYNDSDVATIVLDVV